MERSARLPVLTRLRRGRIVSIGKKEAASPASELPHHYTYYYTPCIVRWDSEDYHSVLSQSNNKLPVNVVVTEWTHRLGA